jgi:serine/threonine-protein kinase
LSHGIRIGQLLDGRFEITHLIESNPTGAIFRAQDRQTFATVAIKVPFIVGDAPISAARCAREAAILAQLDHPGIPKIIPIAAKGRPYLAMEYVPGQTLYDVLEQRRPLPAADAVRLASRLCEILDYIHRRNLVHLDLKPGNIIISDDGAPHIIDFGIARAPARISLLGWSAAGTGTPGYMAPEQIQGDRVDARTDVYGVGAILHACVTGTNGGLDAQLEEIILHAMAPRPSDRYRSAAAMKADLDSPSTVQVTGEYRNPRKPSAWPKRLRWGCFIAACVASPVALFFIFLMMFQHQLAR